MISYEKLVYSLYHLSVLEYIFSHDEFLGMDKKGREGKRLERERII